jgi:hypothetical protein
MGGIPGNLGGLAGDGMDPADIFQGIGQADTITAEAARIVAAQVTQLAPGEWIKVVRNEGSEIQEKGMFTFTLSKKVPEGAGDPGGGHVAD